MSPVDCIFTHFPADENLTTELGRLGEEAKRLNEIFKQASSHSLILLNESFTSTSIVEALYIAKDVIKSLRYIGTRVVYNTHMHDLAHCADEINSQITGDSLVVSVITEIEEGERSYKIKRGLPLDISYAHDIAVKYGICFDQVTAEFSQRNSKE
jgi:DNA mismatch repair ATPase MutS